VIMALSPLLTYAIALAVRAEKLQPVRAAGIVLGLAGVLAIVLRRSALPSAEALPWALAALLAPLMLAGGNVFRTLAWPAGLKPLGAASLLLALQALVLMPLALAAGEFETPSALLRAQDVALIGAGVLTAAFFLGAFELQRRGGPVVVSQLGYVITVASLAIGALVFGERYPLTMLAAVALVFAGVTLVNRRPPPAAAATSR
jgi:drug/metabolite transporter (DMT)-like permease